MQKSNKLVHVLSIFCTFLKRMFLSVVTYDTSISGKMNMLFKISMVETYMLQFFNVLLTEVSLYITVGKTEQAPNFHSIHISKLLKNFIIPFQDWLHIHFLLFSFVNKRDPSITYCFSYSSCTSTTKFSFCEFSYARGSSKL